LAWKRRKQIETIVWRIRLPQALASMVAGAGLAVAGAAMQSILRNPLGSPFTLGISHAAAFGAALSVMILGGGIMTSNAVGAVQITNPYLTTASAFVFSIGAACNHYRHRPPARRDTGSHGTDRCRPWRLFHRRHHVSAILRR
jgi:ABC-type Fe3+-siderophore transport system permease subunit